MKQRSIHFCQALFILSIVAVAAVAPTYGTSRKTSASTSIAHALSVGTEKKSVQTTAKTTFLDTVNTTLAAYPSVQSGVSLIDLDSGTQIDTGETAPFTAASTTKVLTAAVYMHQVEEGSASLDTVLNGSTAETLLEAMLNRSDNNAWHALNEYLGDDQLQNYASTQGLSSYDVTSNVITAHDEAQLLRKLYTGELLDSTHTQLLLSYMQNTNDESLIPAALPQGSTVYHKYGYLDGELHDAAIVSYNDHRYILVIFTKSDLATTSDYTARIPLFHDITEAATAYIQRVHG